MRQANTNKLAKIPLYRLKNQKFKRTIYMGVKFNIFLRVNRRRNKNEPNGGRKQKYLGNSDLSYGMCGDAQ